MIILAYDINNYIIGEIEINEDNINKDIRLINTFEETKRQKSVESKSSGRSNMSLLQKNKGKGKRKNLIESTNKNYNRTDYNDKNKNENEKSRKA